MDEREARLAAERVCEGEELRIVGAGLEGRGEISSESLEECEKASEDGRGDVCEVEAVGWGASGRLDGGAAAGAGAGLSSSGLGPVADVPVGSRSPLLRTLS